MLVITNNLNVAMQPAPARHFEVIVAGGPVRRVDGAVVGSAAVDLIRQFKVDIAVIGASAIDEDGTLLDFDYREVQVAQAIIGNARRVILVADRTKFERTAPVRIAHLSQMDMFVTDHLASPRLRELDIRLMRRCRRSVPTTPLTRRAPSRERLRLGSRFSFAGETKLAYVSRTKR